MTKDAWEPDQYSKFERERAQPFFDLMAGVGGLPKHSRILDLGCGPGDLTAKLHRHFSAKETLGVDSSAAMLEKAEKLVKSENSGLRFAAGDLSTFSDEAGFDLVFANASIHWTSDHPALLERFRKLLRPGGKLAVQVPANQDYPTHRIVSEMLAGQEPPPSVLKPEEYASALFQLGYRNARVRLEVYSHLIENREAVLEWVKGTLLTFVKSRVSESDYARFLIEYRERLFRELPDEKPFFYPFKRILFWADRD